MSASDKLRALDQQIDASMFVGVLSPEQSKVLDALPQIRAVVEALDTILNVNELYSESVAYKTIGEIGRAALAALDEALP